MVEKNNVSMNEELLRWMEESKDEVKAIKDKKDKCKKPKGKCQVCGEKTSITVCLKCNKSVCQACHFKIIGVCKKCIPKDVAGKWDGSNPDWENKLGVKWIE